MSHDAPAEARPFVAPDGVRWEARVVSRSRASPYLAARVSRPTVQFTRLDPPAGAPRYAPLPASALAELGDAELSALLGRSRTY